MSESWRQDGSAELIRLFGGDTLACTLTNVLARELDVRSLEELMKIYVSMGSEAFRAHVEGIYNIGVKTVDRLMTALNSQSGTN